MLSKSASRAKEPRMGLLTCLASDAQCLCEHPLEPTLLDRTIEDDSADADAGILRPDSYYDDDVENIELPKDSKGLAKMPKGALDRFFVA